MISIPYGKTHLTYPYPYNGLLTSRVDQLKSSKPGRQLVEEAMANPIGSRPLWELAAGKIVVVAGFQGLDSRKNVTTLGRGGSDTTAVALAALLEADRCVIFTDVDGVYDRDPRKFPDAVKYEAIDYDSMLALCHSGAQVLHDRSVELARDHGIRIEVRSTFSDEPGTIVGLL